MFFPDLSNCRRNNFELNKKRRELTKNRSERRNINKNNDESMMNVVCQDEEQYGFFFLCELCVRNWGFFLGFWMGYTGGLSGVFKI